MITSLGGAVQQQMSCCMVCNPEFCEGGRLSLQVGKAPPRKRRRVAVRRVDQEMNEEINACLKAERANYIAHHPTLAIIGEQLVCPDSVIDSICSSVKFISVATDLDRFCIRQELKQIFFNAIIEAVNYS